MPTTNLLSGARVREVFEECLFRDDEPRDTFVKAEGIMMTVGFHPTRLADHKEEIGLMLAELPDEFKASGGGGMSFLNACMDRHGNHWAEHPTMDLLLCLGLATEQVRYCMPREMWNALPGGMPYFVVAQ